MGVCGGGSVYRCWLCADVHGVYVCRCDIAAVTAVAVIAVCACPCVVRVCVCVCVCARAAVAC